MQHFLWWKNSQNFKIRDMEHDIFYNIRLNGRSWHFQVHEAKEKIGSLLLRNKRTKLLIPSTDVPKGNYLIAYVLFRLLYIANYAKCISYT